MIVAVTVLPDSVPPMALCSVKPAGSTSVTATLPAKAVTPGAQMGPSCPAGTWMLGTAGPPSRVVKLNVCAAVLALVSALQTTSVPWLVVGVVGVTGVTVRVAVAVVVGVVVTTVTTTGVLVAVATTGVLVTVVGVLVTGVTGVLVTVVALTVRVPGVPMPSDSS